ncbi:MAG: response regulator, partial [Rickettsiales bacterium]
KYTHEGYVLVTFRAQKQSDDMWEYRIKVKDTGIGIKRELHEAIFDKFAQADTSNTRQFGGTGLGLAICKSLSQMMGGDVTIESIVGEGSSFHVSIPLKLANLEKTESPQAVNTQALEGMRILQVDNSQLNPKILSTFFAKWRVDYKRVTDETKAIERLKSAARRKQPFDAVIVDAQFSETEHNSLTRRLKKASGNRDLKCIIQTEAGMRGDASKYKRLGYEGYLTKPLFSGRVLTVLEEALKGRGIAGALLNRRKGDADNESSNLLRIAHAKDIKLLLVEDMATNQMVAKTILQSMGCSVDIASNGVEAVAKAKAYHYEVILMDCQMPVMDGFEATRRIREMEAGGDIPCRPYIIAQTANAMEGDRNNCLAAGMDDYIAKPITKEALQKALLKAVVESTLPTAAGEDVRMKDHA